MELLFDIWQNGANFSDDRMYRYLLWRRWDLDKPVVMFIGLNPSTANETKDDPTIRRVVSFSKKWGYGGVYMTNLFAYVTAHPAELKTCANPLGLNDVWLKGMAEKSERIVFCWGGFTEATERAKEVIAMFPDAYCLGKTMFGNPRHPLYLKGNVMPIRFNS